MYSPPAIKKSREQDTKSTNSNNQSAAAQTDLREVVEIAVVEDLAEVLEAHPERVVVGRHVVQRLGHLPSNTKPPSTRCGDVGLVWVGRCHWCIQVVSLELWPVPPYCICEQTSSSATTGFVYFS